jgi:uncharacterized protein (DUF1800 family)
MMRRITLAAVVLALVLGSPAAGHLSAEKAPGTGIPTAEIPKNPDDRTIIHVLNRLGFGPAPGDVERVRRLGLDAYIDQQLHPERIADASMTARLERFGTLAMSTRQLAEEYFVPAQMERRERQRQATSASAKATAGQAAPDPSMAGGPPPQPRDPRTPQQTQVMRGERSVLLELSQQKVLRAIYSERQLQEVLVDFWFNHFNVFAGKGQVRVYLTEYERDAIRPHVLGKFRDLLGATAESPAMLFYLDNFQSAAPMDAQTMGRDDPRRMRARRLGAGLPPQAQPQPQPRRPRGLNENYARELMELHTLGVDGGYTQKDVQEVARAFTGWTIANPRQGGGFRFEPRIHDDGEKVVLGHRIKAGGGKRDGDHVLDLLARHESTARFIATKLARRLVADQPPDALVKRAAERFRKTDGDIREVVRTIITSPEFFAKDAYRAKTKTPFEFVTSAVRATGLQLPDAQPVVQQIRELGMPLYGCQPPTGYADRAEAWVNTGALLNRMNFAVALTGGRMRNAIAVTALNGATPAAAREHLFGSALGGDVSPATVSTVEKATTVPQTIALILGSPDFQKR